VNAQSRYALASRDYAENFSPAIVADILPEVPALPETLLALDLHRLEFSFDLRGISQVILEDPGATLQILRLAGREYGDSAGSHLRIEDCICDLGVEACLRAVERGAMVQPSSWRAILPCWEHARSIARFARLIAEQEPTGLTPDQAYMGGLLHILGSLPDLLGWKRRDLQGPHDVVGLALAEVWSLPAYIQDIFREGMMPARELRWTPVLEDAHRLVEICEQQLLGTAARLPFAVSV
jgi:HD-like signal output (HDOD) protein